MNVLRKIGIRLRSLLRYGRRGAELDEEIQSHLELRVDELMAQGATDADARRQARREFGNVDSAKEATRDAWGITDLTSSWRSLRFAWRQAAKNLRTSLLAVAIIAAGVGVTVTIFTAVNGIVFSGLGGPHSSRIVHLGWQDGDGVTARDFQLIRDGIAGLETAAAYSPHTFSFRQSENVASVQRYAGARVTNGFFSIAGEPPLRGRTFLAEDFEAGSRTIVSHRIWSEQLGGDPEVLGTTVLINSLPHTVVGIMPEGFGFPATQDLWIADNGIIRAPGAHENTVPFVTIGLLQKDVSAASVQAQLDVLTPLVGMEFSPEVRERHHLRVRPFRDAFSNPEVEAFLALLMGMAAVVLFAACANVLNIVTALTARRAFELAVRTSLGATPGNIRGEILLSGLLLSLAGTGLGVGLAHGLTELIWTHLLSSSSDLRMPYWWHFNMEPRVVGFVALLMIGVTLGSSLLPAVRAARATHFAVLKDGAQASSGVFIGRLSRFLVGAQVCVSVTVCLCALVMVGEVERKTEVPFPFDANTTLTARLTLTENAGLDREDRRAPFLAALRDEMQAIPGVDTVAFSSSEAGLLVGRQSFSLNGQDTPAGRASVHAYTSEAFDVMGLRQLSGRLFTPFDTIDTPKIAVVNRIFAERFLGGADALGQQIHVRGSESSLNVVGVVSDLFPSTAGYGDALIIVPYAQFPSRTVSIIARTEPGASRLAGALQLALAKIAPDLGTEGPFESVRALFHHRQGRIRTLANLLALFSVVSIVSASLGLYGIISYSARARRRELGMRLALGATTAQIIRLVVAQARWQLGSGLATGIVAGFGLIQVMFSFMGGVNFDLLPHLGLVVVFAVGFCMAATGIPAWRASRINPVEVLRGD